MIKYKIYTENKRLKQIRSIVAEYFRGFTIYKTVGFWQGKRERAICIEIITADAMLASMYVNNVCQKIKGLNRQDSILVTKQEVEVVK